MKKKTNNAVHDKIDLQALQESEARFRSIVLWSPDAIIVTDAKGKILYMNPAAEKVFNRKLESFIGKDFGLPLVNGETTEIDICRPGKDPGVGDMHVVETEWLGEKAHLITIRDITGRKRAESQREAALESLRQSEEKYRTILEEIQEGYFEVNLAGNFTFFNDSLCRILGYSKEELVGMNNRQYTDKEAAKKLFQTFNNVYNTGEPTEGFDWQIIRKDGTKRYVEASISLQKDSSGKPTGFRGISRDITERKRAEEKLRESEKRYNALFDSSLDLVYVIDFEGRFIDANNSALNRLGYTKEEIHSLNFASLLSEDQLPLAVKGTQEIRETGIQKNLLEFRLRCKDGTHIYVETHGSVVMSNGTPISILSIARDITERKQVAELLRESEEKYRLVVENANEAIIIMQDWKMVFVNRAAVDMIGYSEEILTSKPFQDIIHPDDRNMVITHVIGKIKGEEVIPVYFFRVVKPDGTIKWVELSATVIHWKERPATLIFLNDTTERKLAETALQKSEENFRLSLDDSPLGVCIVTEEGETLYANQAILDIYGYASIEELRGTPLQKRYTPESYTGLQRRKYKRRKGEFSPSEYEISIVKKNGEVRNVRAFRKEIWWNGAKHFQVIYEDITERRKTEEALRKTEETYRLVVDNIADVITVIDLNLRFTYVSPSIIRLRGYTAEEVMAQTFEQVMTPESLQTVTTVFEEEMKLEASGMADPNRIRILELEEYRKDGSTIWLESHLSSFRDEENKLAGIIALNHDITDRKRAEEELKKSENKYRLLADNVDDVIFVLDMNLKYTYVSPSTKILRGYEPEEVMKGSPADTLTPSSWDLVVKTLSEVMERERIKQVKINESLTLPLEMKRKDGTTVWTEVKFSFIRDENKEPVGILGVTRDITDRKLAEEKLLLSLKNLEKSFSTTIKVMVAAVEMKDPYTAGHQLRVADIARAIATEMGMPQEKIDGIHMAGSIHDIGKLSVPSEILSKPGKLTNAEFTLIKDHSQSGYEMLKNVESPWPLAQIVYQHHERMNGTGYPRNLKGDEILLEARVMAVADVVEAMASHRPYRPALGIEAALEEIEKNKGIIYDDAVADACLRLFREKGYKFISY